MQAAGLRLPHRSEVFSSSALCANIGSEEDARPYAPGAGPDATRPVCYTTAHVCRWLLLRTSLLAHAPCPGMHNQHTMMPAAAKLLRQWPTEAGRCG